MAQSHERPPDDSLFADEQRQAHGGDKPWWQRNFLLHEPVLFGTWDGVFTTVMVNIFGIIVFLRMGWIVGTAGVGHAILLLMVCSSLALITVLSAIGICERCQIQSGGVYFLVSHVLGGRIGGAVGMIYTLGQAVSTGLVAVGFGESVAHFFGTDSAFLTKLVAILVLVGLTAVNMAGVTWVIRLQLILLAMLVLAVSDMLLGSVFLSNPEKGVIGFSSHNFRLNQNPMYDGTNCTKFGIERAPTHESFFTVFGVFMANFLGVLAGVNMSSDLREPRKSIPLGELSAVAVSSGFCFVFILVLGSVATRGALLCDSMIAEQVSLTKLFFLAGLYVCSLSSILGSMYGAPRVLQSIAAEKIIPVIAPLEAGHGPNKNPVFACMVMNGVAIVAVLLGDLNQLAILSTMPFLITYAFVNYSYVSLAMTFDLQRLSDLSDDLLFDYSVLFNTPSGFVPSDPTVTAVQNPKLPIKAAGGLPASYGSMGNIKGEQRTDLDQLFPERKETPIRPEPGNPEEQQAFAQISGDMSEIGAAGPEMPTKGIKDPRDCAIIGQPQSWYSMFCNRYVAFVGAVVNILILVLINPWFAILHFLVFAFLYFYIGQACPGVFPGISEFSIPHMARTAMGKVGGGDDAEQVIVAPLHPGVDTFASRLNEDNPDYAGRKQYHQSTKEQIEEFD